MKAILIDYLSPSGHIPIINFYIKNLEKNFDSILLNHNIKKKINKKKKVKYFHLKKNFITRIIQLAKLFSHFKNKKIKKIIMLSYEPYVLFILGLIIDLDYFKIFIFEHDTLNSKKKIKLLLINFLSKKIIHLVYNKDSKKLLNQNFKRKAIFTNHPIIKIENNQSKSKPKRIILIPTRHHFKKDLIENFIKQNRNFNFYILSKKSNIKKRLFGNFKNAKLFEFIKERDIEKIVAIYLPIDDEVYKYRVSAWLYKGIAYNKKIFMDHNNLYKFEKKRFPNNISLNTRKKINLKDLIIKKKINIHKYNSQLISDLNNSVFK